MNSSANEAFGVVSRWNDDLLTVTLEGELDLAAVDEFSSAIVKAIESDAERIVIDLEGLEFIDSQGLTAVLEADGQSRANGNRLEFRGASGQVARVFTLTGVRKALDR